MYLFLDIGVTALQELESGCGAVGSAVTVAVTPPLQPLHDLAGLVPHPQDYHWRMKRHNLVRQRFLDELENWLTPSLMYHCFTGEDDPYQLARIDRLDPSLQESLLAKAQRKWHQRLDQIAALRKEQKRESKAVVRSFVQSALVGADAEANPRSWQIS